MSIILVNYIARSGSTFLLNNLSKSKEVVVCPEAEILWELFLSNPKEKINIKYEKFRSYFRDDYKLKYWKITDEQIKDIYNIDIKINSFIRLLLEYKNNINPLAKWVIYKSQELIYINPEVIREFKKNINYIFIVRDIRAIYSSQKKTYHSKKNKVLAGNPIIVAKRWNYFIKKACKYKNKEYIYIVKYEDLITHYEEEMSKIISKLNLNIKVNISSTSNLCLPREQLKSHININKKPISYRINAWQEDLSEKDRKVLEVICGDKLKKLDYYNINNYSMGFLFNMYWNLKYFLRRLIQYISIILNKNAKVL